MQHVVEHSGLAMGCVSSVRHTATPPDHIVMRVLALYVHALVCRFASCPRMMVCFEGWGEFGKFEARPLWTSVCLVWHSPCPATG